MENIDVEGTKVSVTQINDQDYISLTDMVKNIENGILVPILNQRRKAQGKVDQTIFHIKSC